MYNCARAFKRTLLRLFYPTEQSPHLPPVAHQLMETFRAGNHSFSPASMTMMLMTVMTVAMLMIITMMMAKMKMIVMAMMMVVIH